MINEFRSGFVAIIGKPNVGKSTLLNRLTGHDISIVTPKAQTTRHHIKGVVNGENFQIVFSDTPGILKPAYKLHKRMMHFVDAALDNTDAVLLIIDSGEKKSDDEVLSHLKNIKIPLLVAINKIDLIDSKILEEKAAYWKNQLNPVALFPVSATENFGLNELFNALVRLMPTGPAYFDKDVLTDKNERFLVTEIIREQILILYKQEIPYSVEAGIAEFKETKNQVTIRCDIFVARKSQKAILIGHKGTAIKNLGIASRLKIEKLLQKKVFLELTVKVRDDWRNDDLSLKRFGYE